MHRLCLLLACCATVAGSFSGCGTNRRSTTPPANAAQIETDPLGALKRLPDELQAELHRVRQPLIDAEVVLDQLHAMPARLGIDTDRLKRLAAASLGDGPIAVDLDLPPDAKAEVEGLLAKIHRVAVDLRHAPERAKTTTATIDALQAKADTWVSTLTDTIEAQFEDPQLQTAARVQLQADLNTVRNLDDDIKSKVEAARQTITSLPPRSKDTLARLTQALTLETSTATTAASSVPTEADDHRA